MTRRDQLFLLGGLAVVWIGVAVIQLGSPTEAKRVPLVNTGKSGHAVATTADGAWHVASWKQSVSDSPATPTRNIFAAQGALTEARSPSRQVQRVSVNPIQSDPSLISSPVVAVVPDPQKLGVGVVQLSPEELAMREIARDKAKRLSRIREDIAQYRVVGFTEQGGIEQVILGRGADIYVLRSGGTLEGRFLVSFGGGRVVTLRDPRSQIERVLSLDEPFIGRS